MRFIAVEIQNFLSFGPRQRIALDRLGLTAIVGRNKDASGATSNGAGKSTIPEAIYWCLFGETLRKVKGDDVVNLTAGKDCEVALEIEEGGRHYRITRTRGTSKSKRPNDLTVSVDGGKPGDSSGGINADTQAQVDTIVGMDKKTFAQVVLLSYGDRPISELGDAEQKRILDDILQNDILVRAREAASKKVRAGQDRIAALDGEIRQATSAASTARARLAKVEEDVATRELQTRTRRHGIQRRRAAVEAEIEKLCSGGLGTALAMEADALAAAQAAQRRIEDVDQKAHQLHVAAAGPRGSMMELKGKIQGAIGVRTRTAQSVGNLAGKTCPTCAQFLDPSAVDTVLAEWGAQVREDQKQLADVEQAIAGLAAELQAKLDGLTAERAAASRDRDAALAACNTARAKVLDRQNALRQVSSLEQQLIALDNELAGVDGDDGLHEKILLDARLEVAVTDKRLARLRQARQHLDAQVQYLLFWEHGFGNQGLKSYLIDSVVPFLNERAQRYADIMSGGDLRVWFTTQREFKKGTTAEEFQIHVQNRTGAETYKGNSDGEKRRSNYAVSWAFADLAAQRAGKPVRLKLMDETFENLDEAGEESVMRLLHDALGTHETILCITHSDRLQAQFDKTITVVKDGGFSHVEV